jgi:hypothetical protein
MASGASKYTYTVRQLMKQGVKAKEIAYRLGITADAVRIISNQERRDRKNQRGRERYRERSSKPDDAAVALSLPG